MFVVSLQIWTLRIHISTAPYAWSVSATLWPSPAATPSVKTASAHTGTPAASLTKALIAPSAIRSSRPDRFWSETCRCRCWPSLPTAPAHPAGSLCWGQGTGRGLCCSAIATRSPWFITAGRTKCPCAANVASLNVPITTKSCWRQRRKVKRYETSRDTFDFSPD